MDQNTLRDRIQNGDRSVLKELDSIPGSDFSFLANYIPPDSRSSELVVNIAEKYSEPWSKDVMFRSSRDESGWVQSLSTQSLKERARPEDVVRLFAELEYRRMRSHINDEGTMNLVLAIGNAGEAKTIEPLLVLKKKETHPEILEAYEMALAKLGFPKETRRLEFSLEHGTPESKAKALKALRYLNQPAWLPKVIPLLMDEMIARHTSLGPVAFRIRVCDEAVTTLGFIDPQKRIPFPVSDIFGYPFADSDILIARRAYGLIK